MSRYKNSRTTSFLESVTRTSIENPTDDLTARCKFNFSYFDHQPAGQNYADWTHPQLFKLMDKLTEYCKQPLKHWMALRVGAGGGRVLVIYDSFPPKSEFSHPKHVPHEAKWGRFRLESAVRLVGFMLPNACHNECHPKTGYRFDCNTFYVVFLDRDHRFYKTEKND